jgi:tetratricopeptide (TPR) repeat protein
MDMLDFSTGDLYFDTPLTPAVEALLLTAAQNYGDSSAEFCLLQAYFYAPEHLTVLVALYRYFYYQQRYPEALIVAERVINLVLAQLQLPPRWQDVTESDLDHAVGISMTVTRFLLLALKGAGYLLMRLGDYQTALQYFEKIAAIDTSNRLGISELLALARAEVTKIAIARVGGNVQFMHR